jgi:hypothetical protein
VQTRTTGAAGRATWTGTAWVSGAAPLELDPHVEHPEDFSVADIKEWVDQHADQADEVLDAERSRPSPRTTLVDWLEGFIESHDGPD